MEGLSFCGHRDVCCAGGEYLGEQPKGLPLFLPKFYMVLWLDEQLLSSKVIINCCKVLFDPSSQQIICVHLSEINKYDHEINVWFRQ